MAFTGAKAAGFAFAAGAAGVYLGSLAAQGQGGFGGVAASAAVLDEGPVGLVEFLDAGNMTRTVTTGTARVTEGWVYLAEQRRYVPRERVVALTFRGGEGIDEPRRPADEFDRPRDEFRRDGRRPADDPGRPDDDFRAPSPRTNPGLPPNGNPGVVPPGGNTFRED